MEQGSPSSLLLSGKGELPNCFLFSSAAPLQRPPLRGVLAGRRLGPLPVWAGILGSPTCPTTTAPRVSEPEEWGEAGRPPRSRLGPLSAPGPVLVFEGLRQTPLVLTSALVALPRACPLSPSP